MSNDIASEATGQCANEGRGNTTSEPNSSEIRPSDSIQNQAFKTVPVDSLREAEVPGLPPPMTGARLDALTKSIAEKGMVEPLIVDDQGLVWAGKSRLRACIKLGHTTVPVRVIPSQDGVKTAWAAAVARQWSPPELAGTILWAKTSAEFKLFRKQASDKLKSHVVLSTWMTEKMGMMRGLKPRNILKYQQLAKFYRDASQEVRLAIDATATLNEAMKYVPRDGTKKKDRDPTKVCRGAFNKLIEAVQKLGDTEVVKDAVAHIQGVMAKVVPPLSDED
jgi:hypothetical protein